jgi:hypothetical protein
MIERFYDWLVTLPRRWWEWRVLVVRERLRDEGIEAIRERVNRLNMEVEIIERKARKVF